MTHPLQPHIGWRFKASDEQGASLVFDVRLLRNRRGWDLLAVYD